jgi:hypothetical protein
MNEEPTTVIIQRYLNALPGDAAAEPIVRELLERAAGRLRLCHDLLDAIATHRVGDRPDRYEPRVKKRRRNHYCWLTKPCAEKKRKIAKGVNKI